MQNSIFTMDNTFLSKLLAKTNIEAESDQKQFLYVESKWLDNSLELHVYTNYNNKTFKGEIKANQFARYASELEIPFNDFYEECKDALSGSMLPQTFEYELIEEDLTFRVIKKLKFAIEYLNIPLKAISNNSVMLDNAVNLINDLRETKNAESKIAKKDENASEELLLQLDNCIKEKDNIEQKMLRKFLLLINSKKKKINELQELLRQNMIDNSNNEEGDNNFQHQNCNDDDDFDAVTQMLSEDDIMEAATSTRIRKKRRARVESENSD